MDKYFIGQRLSLKSQSCTVRYVGPVAGRQGEFLGVEWDDPLRGKHAGSYEGVSYFRCRSSSQTAASFLKPKQPWDALRSFLEALRHKYMSEVNSSHTETVYFSGKEAEQVGFEKFAKRQRQLQGIHVLVLDGMRIRHRASDEELNSVPNICAQITGLDLSNNLFDSIDNVLDLCSRLPSLKALTLDGNRFAVGPNNGNVLPKLRTLSLSKTLLSDEEISIILPAFPSLESLTIINNEFSGPLVLNKSSLITHLDLTGNNLTSLSDINLQGESPPNLTSLVLKHNPISAVGPAPSYSHALQDLDLRHTNINTFPFFDALNTTFPTLHHLRVTGNPLYQTLSSADGKPLAPEDGYMLTIARLPALQTLNYSKITEKERLNAETFYLNQIGLEISLALTNENDAADAATTSRIAAQHPRYAALCDEYGEPAILLRQRGQHTRKAGTPGSLEARTVRVAFKLAGNALPENKTQRSWEARIPRSWGMYSLLGAVARRMDVVKKGMTPLDLRLVLETGEEDPAERERGYKGPEWWDSDDEDEEEEDGSREDEREGQRGATRGETWIKREVELVPGTRMLGTYIEGSEAVVRVETVGRRVVS